LSDSIFYVGAENNKKLTGLVPAKFLMRDGSYVMDPTPRGSQNAYLYSDSSGNNKTPGPAANPNNYLIVPANYDEQAARKFAANIAAAPLPIALARMIDAFGQGGSQDLQRNPHWGIPNGSTVGAFVGSASNHLGYVSAQAGLPIDWPEFGGGLVNGVNADIVQPLRKLFKKSSTDIDTRGPYWLSRQNGDNIAQGYAHGLAATGPPSPFNDYGYDPHPQSRGEQIGDGRGIAGWRSSLSDVNPDEPTPPAWPPQADSPIRYLSSRRVR
jgi:hypothetical protein